MPWLFWAEKKKSFDRHFLQKIARQCTLSFMATLPSPSAALETIIFTPEGAPTTLRAHLCGSMLLVVFVRHFG
ncbi:MAG: hypothetical protein NT107_15815 [Planctomycetota bacterium]|nr:hypothetical protein [Planctomycetota bacterium]